MLQSKKKVHSKVCQAIGGIRKLTRNAYGLLEVVALFARCFQHIMTTVSVKSHKEFLQQNASALEKFLAILKRDKRAFVASVFQV